MSGKAGQTRVTKASGDVEDLDPAKLMRSLRRAGADREAAEEVINRVLMEVGPVASTARIYRLARKHLRRYNHSSSLRYSLKKALFRLGPSGYPFEKYVGEILREHGYETEVGITMQGRCVSHEVDVLAVGSDEVIAVECKYHNTAGKATDVKVAMYVHSRFRDLEPVIRDSYSGRKFAGWLVTNTRCTLDAIRYAECSGFRVVGWRHPAGGSLEKMIEEKLLYPVTIVTGIKRGIIKELLDRGIILLKDLVGMEAEDIQSMLALPLNRARALKRQVDQLCLC